MKNSLEKISRRVRGGKIDAGKTGGSGIKIETVKKEEAEREVIDTENCPVRQVLDRIGDKWSTLVILLLGSIGVRRFNELAVEIGDISQKMLTVTLRHLEADGLVSRKMYAEIPPRVEYELTDLGRSLLPLIRTLETWANENIRAVQYNRKQYAQKAGNQKSSLRRDTA